MLVDKNRNSSKSKTYNLAASSPRPSVTFQHMDIRVYKGDTASHSVESRYIGRIKTNKYFLVIGRASVPPDVGLIPASLDTPSVSHLFLLISHLSFSRLKYYILFFFLSRWRHLLFQTF